MRGIEIDASSWAIKEGYIAGWILGVGRGAGDGGRGPEGEATFTI